MTKLEKWRSSLNLKRTKIICTIGPASSSDEVLAELMKAGMNLARLNFSHVVDYEPQTQIIARIRRISQELDYPVGIFLDLGGPKIRTRRVKNGAIELKTGNTILITHEDIEGNEEIISCTLECLINDAQAGDPILLDDGLLELKVISKIGSNKLRAEIVKGGILKDRKGMNLPATKLSIPVLTEKDKKDIEYGMKQDIDFFALSFVRSAQDINELRRLIRQSDKMIISKVEKPEAVENIDAIIKYSDAVMVARGDMGVEVGNEKVPVIQKKIIQLCNKYSRPVITATQMLESMVQNIRPTRAEASDVANSIFDGTSAVMLSAETAVGAHPIEVVKMMSNIIKEAESIDLGYGSFGLSDQSSSAEAIVNAAITTANKINAKAIVCLTHTGATASILARHRPKIPIIAVTDQVKVLSRLTLLWGVDGIYMEDIIDSDEIFVKTQAAVTSKYLFSSGDKIVICCGLPAGKKVKVNTVKVSTVD